ncbi:MAG: cadherin-like domain-containing protein [Cyanobacteriota bacterium]|nr:cadherin-like domain-containing protein [Cyanobacteriota bacterium]
MTPESIRLKQQQGEPPSSREIQPVTVQGFAEGTEQGDYFIGSVLPDSILSFLGDDTIFGLGENDVILTDEGRDQVNGNDGNDTVQGGNGDDCLRGGKALDFLLGDSGNDSLYGDREDDILQGGAGNDTIFGGKDNDSIVGNGEEDSIMGDRGNDTVSGNEGNDTLLGGDGGDRLSGNEGGDLITGQSGADIIDGGTGEDSLFGGQDNDSLFGDAGNDFVSGDVGADTLSGGDGQDTLVLTFEAQTGGDSNADFITDFAPEDDTIGLRGLTFQNLNISQGTGDNSEDTFIRLNGSDGDLLAVLIGVDSSTLDLSEFIGLPSNIEPPPLPTPTEPVPSSTGSLMPIPTDPTPEPTPTTTTDPTPEPTPSTTGVEPTPSPTPTETPTPEPNRRPEPEDDNLVTNQDAPLTFTAGELLSNDSDPDEDSLNLVNIGTPQNGSLVETGSLTYLYTPNSGFLGSDNFLYSVTDGRGGTTTALVNIKVNDPPVLVNSGSIVLEKNGAARIITGDELQVADTDNSPEDITYTLTRRPGQGSLRRRNTTLNLDDEFSQAEVDNGNIRYVSGNKGRYSFSVTASDGDGGAIAETNFSITVVDETTRLNNGNNNRAGTNLSDYILGSGGNDTVNGAGDSDVLDGGAGNDRLVGGVGNDCLFGAEQPDTLFGGVGNDSLDGGSDNDSLLGEEGNDFLFGAEQEDTLRGGVGNDTLSGGAGRDTLLGEDDSDSLLGGDASDSLNGGAGNDTLRGEADSDFLNGEVGSDFLDGGFGNDTLSGGANDDTLEGAAGNDNLIGEQGNDLLRGNDDNDVIFGGFGDDTLSGGFGSDRLLGEQGRDAFYFESPNEGVDIIPDFNADEVDVFLFESAKFGGLTNPAGTITEFTSIILPSSNLGSQSQDISGQELIIFENSFNSVQAVNSFLQNQNGSGDGAAFFLYVNNTFNPGEPVVTLGYDPVLNSDVLPAVNLAILTSLPVDTNAISTRIDPSDFKFI